MTTSPTTETSHMTPPKTHEPAPQQQLQPQNDPKDSEEEEELMRLSQQFTHNDLLHQLPNENGGKGELGGHQGRVSWRHKEELQQQQEESQHEETQGETSSDKNTKQQQQQQQSSESKQKDVSGSISDNSSASTAKTEAKDASREAFEKEMLAMAQGMHHNQNIKNHTSGEAQDFQVPDQQQSYEDFMSQDLFQFISMKDVEEYQSKKEAQKASQQERKSIEDNSTVGQSSKGAMLPVSVSKKEGTKASSNNGADKLGANQSTSSSHSSTSFLSHPLFEALAQDPVYSSMMQGGKPSGASNTQAAILNGGENNDDSSSSQAVQSMMEMARRMSQHSSSAGESDSNKVFYSSMNEDQAPFHPPSADGTFMQQFANSKANGNTNQLEMLRAMMRQLDIEEGMEEATSMESNDNQEKNASPYEEISLSEQHETQNGGLDDPFANFMHHASVGESMRLPLDDNFVSNEDSDEEADEEFAIQNDFGSVDEDEESTNEEAHATTERKDPQTDSNNNANNSTIQPPTQTDESFETKVLQFEEDAEEEESEASSPNNTTDTANQSVDNAPHHHYNPQEDDSNNKDEDYSLPGEAGM